MARLEVDRLFSSSASVVGAGETPRLSPSRSPFASLFRREERGPGRLFRGPESERRGYISGDTVGDFFENFERALQKGGAIGEVVRASAALVDFEGVQERQMRGAMDWLPDEIRVVFPFAIGGLFLLLRNRARLPRQAQRSRTWTPQPQSQTKAQAQAQTPQTGPSESEVRAGVERAKCEICNVDLIQLDEHTAMCPSCNHEYRRG